MFWHGFWHIKEGECQVDRQLGILLRQDTFNGLYCYWLIYAVFEHIIAKNTREGGVLFFAKQIWIAANSCIDLGYYSLVLNYLSPINYFTRWEHDIGVCYTTCFITSFKN